MNNNIKNIVIREICEFDDFLDKCELLEKFISESAKLDNKKYSEIYTWDLDYIEEISASEIYEVYIMLYKGAIVGCLKIDLFSDSFYISDILISYKHRRKGLARMLINSAIKNNKDKTSCDLDVQCENGDAIIAYIKMGFVVSGFWCDDYKWLRMRRLNKNDKR